MNMQIVDMAVFWWQVAAPAAAAILLAAGYIAAAWKWPGLRTPVVSWHSRRTLDDALAEALYRGLRHDEAMDKRKYGGKP